MSRFNDQRYDVLPLGEYETKVINMEIVSADDETALCVRSELEIVEGVFKGRRLFTSMTLKKALFNKIAEAI